MIDAVLSFSFSLEQLTVNVVYNKLSQRPVNLSVGSILPRAKVWFSIVNDTLYALPLFGDYRGPFSVRSSNGTDWTFQFEISPSPSLFSPSNHLLLARFNLSAATYRNASFNRYLIVQSLALALNLSHSLLTIHRINGSLIKVYFSCDFYTSTNLTNQIQALISRYEAQRVHLLSRLPLPLIEISIVRLAKLNLKRTMVTSRPRLLSNHTMAFLSKTSNLSSPLLLLHQFSQPLVLVPLIIIVVGLLLCSLIAFCLCCNRRSSSSSTLLLPSGPSGSPNNKHLYQNYAYRKHRQQQQIYKRKHHSNDQRQYISKGRESGGGGG